MCWQDGRQRLCSVFPIFRPARANHRPASALPRIKLPAYHQGQDDRRSTVRPPVKISVSILRQPEATVSMGPFNCGHEHGA